MKVSTITVDDIANYIRLQEVDEADKVAYHVWLKDENGIAAYARVLPKGATFSDVSIGRVIAVKRRSGIGSKLIKAAIDVAKEKFNATKIIIGAQVYARSFYEKAGFRQISEQYVEDGIPHIHMELSC